MMIRLIVLLLVNALLLSMAVAATRRERYTEAICWMMFIITLHTLLQMFGV